MPRIHFLESSKVIISHNTATLHYNKDRVTPYQIFVCMFVIRRKIHPIRSQRCENGDASTVATLALPLPPPPLTGPATDAATRAARGAGAGAEVTLISEEDARSPQSLGATSPHLTCARRPQSSHSSTAFRTSRLVQMSHLAPPPGRSPLAKKK